MSEAYILPSQPPLLLSTRAYSPWHLRPIYLARQPRAKPICLVAEVLLGEKKISRKSLSPCTCSISSSWTGKSMMGIYLTSCVLQHLPGTSSSFFKKYLIPIILPTFFPRGCFRPQTKSFFLFGICFFGISALASGF